MQRIFSSWIMAALFIFPSLALAMENHTLSLGYAQTHLSALNKSASKDLHGLNLKYRYEFNSDYLENFEKNGMVASGINPDTKLVETIELKKHPFYVGVQYHPEYKSTVATPHPLFTALVKAASK